MAANEVNIVIRALDKTRSGFGSVTKGLKTVAGGIFSLKTALAGALGAGGIGLLVKQSLDATDALSKTASRIGTTTEALGRLQYAGKLTGVEISTMNMALQRFTRRVAEAARGTGEAQGALKELNLDAASLTGLSLDDQMVLVAGAFDNVSSKADKVRLAFKLFDSEGVALVNTLNLGSEEMKILMNEADTLGLIMSQKAAKGVEEANDSLYRLSRVATGIRDTFVAGIAPAIKLVADNLVEFAKSAVEAQGGFQEFGKNLAVSFLTFVRDAGVAIIELKEKIAGITEELTNIQNLVTNNSLTRWFKGISDTIKGNNLSFQIETIRKEIEKIDDLITATPSGGLAWYEGQEMSIGQLLEKIQQLEGMAGRLQEQQLLGSGALDGFTASVDSGSEATQNWNNTINGLIASLDTVFETLNTEGSESLESTKTIMETLSASIRKAAEALPTMQQSLDKIVGSTLTSFTDGITNAITGVNSLKDSMKDMAKSVITDLIRMAVQAYITLPLFNFLFPGAGLGSMLPSLPGRAIGGSVQAGKPYMVGERGAEMFVPNQSGSIVPNNRMGGGGITIVNNVDATGSGADVDQKIYSAMQITSQQTIGQIQDLIRRQRLA